MGAQLHDPPVHDDGDPVGVGGRVETVGHLDDGAPGQRRGQGPLQGAGGARVQQRGGLVQDERVRVQQHQPGQRHLLGLSGAELEVPRADHRVHPLGQSVHPGIGPDGLNGLADRVVGGTRPPQAHVVRHGSDEHVVLLGHQGHVAAQLVLGQVRQRHPAHGDAPGGGRVDARQHPPQRGLARPRGPDDGQPLPGHELQVDPVEHLDALPVGEAHVVEHDPRALGLFTGGGAVVGDLLHPQDAGQGGLGDLDLVDPEHELAHRLAQLHGVEGHGGNRPQGRVAAGGQEPAPQEDDDDGRPPGDVEHHEQAHPQRRRVALQGPGLLDGGHDGPLAARPDAQGVHGLGVLDRLGDRPVEAGLGGRLGPVGGDGDRQVPAHHQPHGRGNDEQPERQEGVGDGSGQEREDDRHHAHEDLRDPHPHEELDAGDVGGGAPHEVAGAGGLHGAQRQVHHPVHHALAQVGEDRLTQGAGVLLGEAVDERPHERDRDDSQHDPVHVAGVGPPGRDPPDQPPQQLRGHERGQDRRDLEDQDDGEAPPVGGHDPEGFAQGDGPGRDGKRHQ